MYLSNSWSIIFESNGLIIEPCGDPIRLIVVLECASFIFVLSILLIRLMNCWSLIFLFKRVKRVWWSMWLNKPTLSPSMSPSMAQENPLLFCFICRRAVWQLRPGLKPWE
nr:hypothetical protein [Oedogonium sp. 260_circle1_72169]